MATRAKALFNYLQKKTFLGGKSQNFLGQNCKIFVIFRCFYKAIINKK